MNIGDYEVIEGLYYSKEHEWVRIIDEKTAEIGITDYAAKLLNDVVYVGLPTMGAEVKQNGIIGSVESIKAVSDVYSPISGKVTKVNENLNSTPEIINQSPYQDGWIVQIVTQGLPNELELLFSPDKYTEYLKNLVGEKS